MENSRDKAGKKKHCQNSVHTCVLCDGQLPRSLNSGGYELRVRGTGGLTFTNKTRITFNSKAKSVLVQTDKAMYKPGQKGEWWLLFSSCHCWW